MAASLKYDEVPPIVLPAIVSPARPEDAAVVVFLHGLGSKAADWTELITRLQERLTHISFHLPTAPLNPSVPPNGKTAWLLPLFSGGEPPTSRPTTVVEDHASHLASVDYLDNVISEIVATGVPPKRIVLAGFSQGGIISLLHLFISKKFAGKLAGTVSICGYLPMQDEIKDLQKQRDIPSLGSTKLLLAQGKDDVWVPRWMWEETLTGLRVLGFEDEDVQAREYEGGHEVGQKLQDDLVKWLGEVLRRA